MTTNYDVLVGDDFPVTGGVAPPPDFLDDTDFNDPAPVDALGRMAYWLLKIHKGAVSLKFRNSDLASMDDDTKRLLIADIQKAIGVKPLKSNVL